LVPSIEIKLQLENINLLAVFLFNFFDLSDFDSSSSTYFHKVTITKDFSQDFLTEYTFGSKFYKPSLLTNNLRSGIDQFTLEIEDLRKKPGVIENPKLELFKKSLDSGSGKINFSEFNPFFYNLLVKNGLIYQDSIIDQQLFLKNSSNRGIHYWDLYNSDFDTFFILDDKIYLNANLALSYGFSFDMFSISLEQDSIQLDNSIIKRLLENKTIIFLESDSAFNELPKNEYKILCSVNDLLYNTNNINKIYEYNYKYNYDNIHDYDNNFPVRLEFLRNIIEKYSMS